MQALAVPAIAIGIREVYTTTGMSPHRLKDNPQEARFATAWAEWIFGRTFDTLRAQKATQ